MRKTDIAVIGGGASGLAAAIAAKRTTPSLNVTIFERLPKVGKKILATGNGRCNLSNTDVSPERYSGTCKNLIEVTQNFSVPDFFTSLGVICETDESGRIYPRCRSAASVLDALRLECTKLGIEEVCEVEISGLDRNNVSDNMMLAVTTGNKTISAKKIILAGGGMSQPSLGSNGSLLNICRDLGIEVEDPFPALVPLSTDPKLVRPLKGQRADANVMFFSKGKCIKSERGEVQFTDGLVSGICVFDLSYLYDMYSIKSELHLDLLPDISGSAVTSLLKNIRHIRSGASADDLLSGIFTRPLGSYVIKRAISKPPKNASDFDDEMLCRIASVIKSLSFPITGTAGFERSQVTGGGIVADEVACTFELKKIKGLYACGELLDVYGRCGGYNLDLAFSSGYIAGRDAALEMKR